MKGGLDQEDEPHLTTLEPQGPHHPDLLSSLDHRPGGDDAQSADADHEPEAHETPQEDEDDPPRGVVVPDRLRRNLRLEATPGELSLRVMAMAAASTPLPRSK